MARLQRSNIGFGSVCNMAISVRLDASVTSTSLDAVLRPSGDQPGRRVPAALAAGAPGLRAGFPFPHGSGGSEDSTGRVAASPTRLHAQPW